MQRHRQIAYMVLFLMAPFLFPGLPASGQQTSNANAWYRWDVPLTTSRSYHLNLGNPYRDLTIQTTFTPTSCSNSPWCGTFTGYGFWDGGTTFRIRSAFPVGTWRWEVSCRGVSNGIDCASDTALNTYVNGTKTTTWGTVTVTADAAAPELLKRGFVRMEVKSGRYLTYGDGVAKLFWQADTSWKAAITDQSSHTNWNTFLSDRKSRGFTVILMAPSSSADDPGIATGTLFEDLGTNCLGNAWPKSCSRWRPVYWRTLDEKIRLANEQGFLVVLIGVMDPQGNPSSGPKYPRPEDAAIFARNLVARLSGNHVIFSPSFDDRLADTQALMDAVGNALRQASPRHLVTAHLAGASSVIDYQTVANKEWHCFHFFQSGHAFNLSTACPSGPSEQYDCAVLRARTLPDALYDNAVPLTMALGACPGIAVPQPNPVYKPNVNGEGAYDWTYSATTTQMIDTPAGVRHTGYYSTLSGAFGFSLGVKGIYDWTNVSSTPLGSDGSRHMAILGSQFRQQPWQALQKSSTLIKNQPAREDQKIVMAVTNDNNFAMLYLPNNGEALINASSLLGFDCSTSTWSKSWIDPKSGNPPSQVPGCENPTSSNPWHTLRRPLCNDFRGGETGNCDWVVILKKTGSTFPSAVMEDVDKNTVPEVYPRLREDGAGWEIAARLPASASSRVSVSVSSSNPSRDKLLRLPVAAGLTDGSTLIVWQGEDLDGDLHGVFARVLGANGTPAGRELRVNETTRHGQINPAVAATSSGGAIVAWSSYAQDGELGGIFLRVYSGQGRFATDEILVNETPRGHQDFPRVAAGTDGNFAVAWTSDRWDGLGSSIYARLFDSEGQALGPEIIVKEAALEGDHYLTDLAMEKDGGFTVIWSSYGPLEAPLGIYKQRFDSDGMPVGEELLFMAATE